MARYTNIKLINDYIALLELLDNFFLFFLLIYTFKILGKDVLPSNVKLMKRNNKEKLNIKRVKKMIIHCFLSGKIKNIQHIFCGEQA